MLLSLAFDLDCPNSKAIHFVFIEVKQDTSEGKDVAAELKCVLDDCIYPQTCRWNERCMEEGMRASKEAKMAREKDLRREMDKDNED